MNSAQSNFREEDYSFSPVEVPAGISGISIVTKRGPLKDTQYLVTTTENFFRRYGGLMSTTEGPLQAQLLLDNGSQVRVNRIVHYDDITDPDSYDAVFAEINDTNGTMKTTITGALASGNYQLAVTGMTSVTVAYNTSALQTMKDLAYQFYLTNKSKLLGYGVISATSIWLAPSYGYTLAGQAITGTGVTGTTNTAVDAIYNSAGEPLFIVSPIGPGADYNKLVLNPTAPSNGTSDSFNLEIWIQGEERYKETYRNLKIPGKLNTDSLNFLQDAEASSNLVIFDYVDLTSISGSLVPQFITLTFDTGDDGSAVTDTDYSGSSAAKTGWYAFDSVDDIVSIGAPTESSAAVHQSGAAYANSRQDLVYFAHLSNGLTTENALATARDNMLIDSSFMGFFAGGLKVIDPLNNKVREISELGVVMALAAKSGVAYGMNKSFAGENRGIILGTQGPVNNFGYPGNITGMNLLANHQINTVIATDGKVMLWNCLTGQIEESLLSFMNVRRALIYVKSGLRSIIRRYIEEDNIIGTWKLLHSEVENFLYPLSQSNWFFPSKEMPKGYRWEGDQDAKDLDSLLINNKQDVLNGKYLARMFCTPTPAMREVEVVVTVIGSSISLEEILH